MDEKLCMQFCGKKFVSMEVKSTQEKLLHASFPTSYKFCSPLLDKSKFCLAFLSKEKRAREVCVLSASLQTPSLCDPMFQSWLIT